MRGGHLARTLSAVAVAAGGLLAVSRTADAAPQPHADQMGTIARNGVPVSVNITTAGQNARFTFSSVAGQQVSAYLSASTFGTTCGAVTLSLLRPNGSAFGNTVSTCNQTAFLDSQTLDTDGNWTIFVDPQGTRTGTASLQAFNTNDETGLVHLDGTGLPVNMANAGQNALIKFSGTTGQKVSAHVTGANFTGCPAFALSLVRPNGTAFGNRVTSCNAAAFLEPQVLDQTGQWFVFIDPQGMTTGTATLQAYDDADEVRALPLNGAPINVVLVPGQLGKYTFSGTTGQLVSSTISASTFTGCPAYATYLRRPNGTTLGAPVNGCGATGFADTQKLDQNGTWSIVVDPVGANEGTANINGYTFVDDTGAILLTGKPAYLDFNKPGQNARWTFAGTSGQHVSAYVTKSTVAPCGIALSLIRPNGTMLGSAVNSCSATDFLEPRVLDQTGTWTAVVDPQGVGTGTATLRVYEVVDESLPFRPGAPLKTFTSLVPGRNASYHFTGKVGDARTVTITGSTYPGCPSLSVSFVRPDATVLKSTTTCTKLLTLTASSLDADGTWNVFIDPQGAAMGTMIIRIT